MTKTPQMFVDDTPEAPPVPVVDRSTLERYAVCPLQAVLIDQGIVSNSGTDCDMGNEVHAILSEAVKARATDGARPDQLRDLIDGRAANSRPDVQPMVLDALRRTYPIIELLCRHDNGQERAPDDLLRYDGGDGEAGGQLAADLEVRTGGDETQTVRLTAEVDLLLATESREELDLWDWKAGRVHWTATDVKASFQFQFYAWLVFRNYQNVRRVNVRVYMTREASATSVVTFEARDFFGIERRLASAAYLFLKYRAAAPQHVPAWPAPEKCAICPAAIRCHAASKPAADLATDPERFLREYAATEAKADQMRAALTLKVRKEQRDLRFDGIGFGVEEPRKESPRAKPCKLYVVPEAGGQVD